jgi:hypothetical protein
MAAWRRSRSLATMSDSATAPAPATQRVGAPVRREPPGRVTVGDYVGQLAASAVQAVRRAGLRPGLDRSFGCEADLIGLTVAQDPPAGCEITRNGIVTLYVAAPGAAAEPDGQSADRAEVPTEETMQVAPPASEGVDALAVGRRRRKPGRAADREQERLEVAPEPTVRAGNGLGYGRVPADTGRDEQNDEPQPQAAQTWAAETAEVPFGAEHEPSYETLLAEDVFAGHAGGQAAWGRRDPRDAASRAWRGALSWARGHPVLATCVCAMLAVWAAVALAGSLAGPRGGGAAEVVPSASPAPRGTQPRRAPARNLAIAEPRPAQKRLEQGTHTAEPYRQRATPRQMEPTAAPPEGANTVAQPEPQPLPAASAQPSRATAPAQSGGGPFSP